MGKHRKQWKFFYIPLRRDLADKVQNTLKKKGKTKQTNKNPRNFNDATHFFIPKYISLFYFLSGESLAGGLNFQEF